MNNRESIDEGLHPTREQTPHEVRAVGGPHPGKAKEHDAAVRPGLDDHELTEVLVIRQQHTTAGDRTFENIHIGNRGRKLRNPVDVVPVCPEPRHHGTDK